LGFLLKGTGVASDVLGCVTPCGEGAWKMNMRAIYLCGLLLTLPALVTGASASLDGQAAPDFVLKSLTGSNLRLSEYRGEVVMINFWATWCGRCRTEMPLLDEMYDRYRKVGFTLLGVNIDDDRRRAAEMAQSLGLKFPVLFDESKKVSRMYDVDDMPVTLLIDRGGVVRYVNNGFPPGSEEAYVDKIRTLLRE